MTGRCGDQVDLGMYRDQRSFENHHREDRRTHRDVAGARGHRIGRDHAGARVALGRTQRNAGVQTSARVKEQRPLNGERPRRPAGVQWAGEDLLDAKGRVVACQQVIDLRQAARIPVVADVVDREHAGRVAHPEHLASGELPVHVARQCGAEVELAQVRFIVEDGLVEMRDRPAQRHVVLEQIGELRRCPAGRGVPPGAERHELASVLVERQIAVHHRRDANSREAGRTHAVASLGVGQGNRIGLLNALPDRVQRVGPGLVDVPVLPAGAACRESRLAAADNDRLDPGGAELNAQPGVAVGQRGRRRARMLCHRHRHP